MAYKIITQFILALTVGAALLCAPVKADECTTVDRFASDFAKEGVVFLGSTSSSTKRMAKVLNDNKEAAGQPTTEISLFLFGPVNGKNGPGVIAATVDKAGCVNMDSVVILTLGQFIAFMKKSMSTSRDIIPLNGA